MTYDYLHWEKQTITDFSPENITPRYARGYVFTRPEEGYMEQTRSVRIDLSKFKMSSENRRILKKTEQLSLVPCSLPLDTYTWEIGKMGKDFYETKFGDGTFSANKIKELLTSERRDFNLLLSYVIASPDNVGTKQSTGSLDNEIAASPSAPRNNTPVGYAICVETPTLLHYSYPFYDLDADKYTGMGMMVRAVQYAKETGKQYCYLGSAQRPGDTYKFQFTGMEWYDGEVWQTDLNALKKLLLDY